MAGSVKALGRPFCAEFVPGEPQVFLLGTSLEPVLYDYLKHREVYRVKGYYGFQVKVHPDGRVLSAVEDLMSPVVFTNDGRLLYTASDDGHMRAFQCDDWAVTDETQRDSQRLDRLQRLLGMAP